MRRRQFPLDSIEVEGNNGGSYVRLGRAEQEGFCTLEVGETCIGTVSCTMSVVALAAILTQCKDEGFQTVLDRYAASAASGGSPSFTPDADPIAGQMRRAR